jgi:hypothetical protein
LYECDQRPGVRIPVVPPGSAQRRRSSPLVPDAPDASAAATANTIARRESHVFMSRIEVGLTQERLIHQSQHPGNLFVIVSRRGEMNVTSL